MSPREVFEAMRPFYPHWPMTFDEALRAATHGDSVAVICTAMARHPGRLRAWLDWKAPVMPSAADELPFVVSRKRAPTLDWKMRAAGEKEND